MTTSWDSLAHHLSLIQTVTACTKLLKALTPNEPTSTASVLMVYMYKGEPKKDKGRPKEVKKRL